MQNSRHLILAVLALAGAGLAYRERPRLKRWWRYRRMMARLGRLCETDPEIRAHRTQRADLRWISQGEHAVELLRRACERFAERPGLQSHTEVITFGQLWQRAEALGAAMQNELKIQPQQRVALCGFGSIDWMVADLACLMVGAVSVPISHRASVQEAQHIIEQTGSTHLFVEGAELSRLRELTSCVISLDEPVEGSPALREIERQFEGRSPTVWIPDQASALHSIVYTSGSTGQPKGVMLPYSRWSSTMRDAVGSRAMPRIALGYLPLAHMAGRIGLYKQLMTGGKTCFVAERDRSDLIAEVRRWRPTHLLLVPAASQLFYQHFQSLYLSQGGNEGGTVEEMLDSPTGRRVAERMRQELFGGRLCFVHTGAAPTASQVRVFLEEGLDLHLTDVYGSTEMGPVAVNGRVHSWVKYKLVDRPELGFTRQDKPFPRGELAVLSPRGTLGYFNNDSATAELRDQEGYVLSGDIVEERGPRELVWLDRSQSVLRMAHGKFVNVSSLEELYTAHSPYLQQLYLHGNPLKSYLLGVVVPTDLLPKNDPENSLRSEFSRIAGELGLSAHEVPRDFLIHNEPFSQENGFLSGANKLRRPRLKAAFEDQLRLLEEGIEALQYSAPASSAGSLREQMAETVARTLGLPHLEIAERSFVELGGDSLGAVRLAQELEQRCGLKISVGQLLDPTTSLESLIDQPREDRFEVVHGERQIRAADLTLENFGLKVEMLEERTADQPCILLTGSNGFLGRSLCLSLAKRLPPQGQLICLVRGKDDESARTRLEHSFSQGAAREFWRAWVDGSQVEIIAGDLSLPKLGLEPTLYERLCQQVTDIVHAGALVNHTLTYHDLFSTNVGAISNLAALATTGPGKGIHYISTAGLVAGLKGQKRIFEQTLASQLWETRQADGSGYAHGYISSKWAGEVLLEDFHRLTGLPVTISRCSMLLPSRLYPREFNQSDTFCRLFWGLLRTGLAPKTFYRGRDQHHYDGLPVDLVADFLVGLALAPVQDFRVFHVCNHHWNDGVSLDKMVDWASELRPLKRLPYDEFFARFKEELERLPEAEMRQRSPLPILYHWSRPQSGRELTSRLETSAFAGQLAEPVPVLDRAYLARSLAAMVEDFPD